MRKNINVVHVPTISVDAEITHKFESEERTAASTAITAGVIAGTIFVAGVAWHGAKRLVNGIRRHRKNKVEASAVDEIVDVLEENDNA